MLILCSLLHPAVVLFLCPQDPDTVIAADGKEEIQEGEPDSAGESAQGDATASSSSATETLLPLPNVTALWGFARQLADTGELCLSLNRFSSLVEWHTRNNARTHTHIPSLLLAVQKTATEVSTSLQTVDWKKELVEFRDDLKAEAELARDSVEHLPEGVAEVQRSALQPENLAAQKDRLVQGVNACVPCNKSTRTLSSRGNTLCCRALFGRVLLKHCSLDKFSYMPSLDPL